MRTIISKTENVTSLKTVVFYQFNKFIPANVPGSGDRLNFLADSEGKKVLKLSSKNSSDLTNFSRYEFKFNPKVDKYRDHIFSNLLGKLDRKYVETLGKENGDTCDIMQVLESIAFPQLTTDPEEEAEDEYFGILNIDGQSLVLLDVPENAWKIEMYNREITSNYNGKFYNSDALELLGINSEDKPVVSIYLGPEEDVINNPASYYYSWGTYPKRTKTIDILEYSNLSQEITSSEIFWMLISSDSSIRTINLSSDSWVNSINPNRNLHSFSLRADQFMSECGSLDTWTSTNHKDKLLFDDTSRTLLSVTPALGQEKYPILRNKLLRTRTTYSENAVYGLYDVVECSGNVWKSVTPGNIYNNPEISGAWILDNTDYGNPGYTSLFITGSLFNTDQVSGVYGKIEPSGSYNVKYGDSLTLDMSINIGYCYADLVCISDTYGNKFTMSNDEDGYYRLEGKENGRIIIFDDIHSVINRLIQDQKLVESDQYTVCPVFTQEAITIKVSQSVKKDWPKNSGNERIYYSSSYIEGTGIETYINGVMQDVKDIYKVQVKDTVKFISKITDESNCLYNFTSWSSENKKDITSTNPEELLIENVDFHSLRVVAQYESKTYKVKATKFEQVDLDVYEITTEYGKSAVIRFVNKDGSRESNSDIIVYEKETGNVVNKNSGIYSVINPSSSADGIGSFTISEVKKNYNIEFI